MPAKQLSKETGISAMTGKSVVIRHATESDMVFIEESLKKDGIAVIDLQAFQFVVAAENSDIIGFGGLRRGRVTSATSLARSSLKSGGTEVSAPLS
jgi:hypothetical protein